MMPEATVPKPEELYLGNFKKRFSFDCRKDKASYMLKRYNRHRFPICVEFEPGFPKEYLCLLDGQKYLIPSEFQLGTFIGILRKKMKSIPPKKALFLLINKKMPKLTDTIQEIYDKEKDDDNFLYICICLESTFGGN